MKARRVGKMRFQLDLSQPLYEQVLDQVRSSIARGEIALGEKMPSVRDMAHALKINPNTVMRAYQELERDGLTETRRGQGTFVTTEQKRVNTFRKVLAQQMIDDFMIKIKNLGFSWEDVNTYMRTGELKMNIQKDKGGDRG